MPILAFNQNLDLQPRCTIVQETIIIMTNYKLQTRHETMFTFRQLSTVYRSMWRLG